MSAWPYPVFPFLNFNFIFILNKAVPESRCDVNLFPVDNGELQSATEEMLELMNDQIIVIR